MRKFYMGFLLVVLGLGFVGCPNGQYDLVGTAWSVDVSDTNGDVCGYDSGSTLGDLSGSWYFYSDGTLEIDNQSDEYGVMEGTYTFDGTTVEFSAELDDSESTSEYQWEEHISISGSLTFDGTALQGTGTYATSWSDSEYPEDDCSLSGDCIISSHQPTAWWIWLLLLYLLALLGAALS